MSKRRGPQNLRYWREWAHAHHVPASDGQLAYLRRLGYISVVDDAGEAAELIGILTGSLSLTDLTIIDSSSIPSVAVAPAPGTGLPAPVPPTLNLSYDDD